MPGAVIRATRSEVSDRFPLLGFTVRTGSQPFFETAIMTSPELAEFVNKGQRTPDTFWSSRGLGPLNATNGEAVFMIPDDVLRRFVGKQRLYYTIATFSDSSRANPEIPRNDPASMPYVALSPNFSQRRARQIVGARGDQIRWNGKNGGYADPTPTLEWAGDVATPGTEAVTPPSTNGGDGASGEAPATPAGFSYDDGFDDALWRGPRSRSRSLGVDTFPFEWPDVVPIAETKGMSSWIAAAATIASWLAGRAGQLDDLATKASDLLKNAASIDLIDITAFANAWDMVPASGSALGVQEFRNLVATMGPLWIAAAGSPHAVVVSGIQGDGTSDGSSVRIKDPWSAITGATGTYDLPFKEFVTTFSTLGDAASAGMHVLHLKEGLVQGRIPGLAAPAVAQARESLSRRRSNGGARVGARAAAAPAVVPIVSTIVGATMTRVMNNEGDVKWELDQVSGLKHPGDDSSKATGASMKNAPALRVEGWPKVETGLSDDIYADFEINWQYNGTSLGNIAVNVLHTNDAWQWGLEVKETIRGDGEFDGQGVAAVRVRFQYVFDRTLGPDAIAIREFQLRADGTFVETDSRWTQQPEGWTSVEQSLASRAQNIGAAIAGEVAGPIINTVLKWLEASVEGDITYKMPDYLNGWKYVDDNTSIVGVGPVDTKTVTIKGPFLQNGDEVGLDLLVRWDYDGSKLGYVSVRPANPRDAVGWGLHVDVVPHDERKNYRPNESPGLAAIRLECTYKFDAPPYYDDSISNMDVLLYGDGTYSTERH